VTLTTGSGLCATVCSMIAKNMQMAQSKVVVKILTDFDITLRFASMSLFTLQVPLFIAYLVTAIDRAARPSVHPPDIWPLPSL
jgi:hypothetical protein